MEGKIEITRPTEILDIKVLNLGEIRELYRKGELRAGRANLEPVESYLRKEKYSLDLIKTLF